MLPVSPYFRKLAVRDFEGKLELKKYRPPLDPKSGDTVAPFQDVLSLASDSCLHKPDLITTSIGLHGRVISGAVVDIALVGGWCALQGGA